MDSKKFYDRRKVNREVDSADRRTGKSRDVGENTSSERRRLASQSRRYERESIKIPVCLKRGSEEVSGYTHDISPAGLLVYTDNVLVTGTSMTLQFSFGSVCNLNISGIVASCREKAIGIKFSEIRDWEQKILSFAVQELKQSAITQEKSSLNILVCEEIVGHEVESFSIRRPRTLEQRPSTIRKSAFHASKIIGWGSYLPPQEVTAKDINLMVKANGYKNVGEVVETLTGIKSRRYADSDLYPSDLAAMAAKDALSRAGIDPKDLDVIIFFGISRDFHEPATANVVQEKIGAENAYVFDLANACNGFVTAVDMLDAMIASGRCETGMVVTGENISPYIDWEPKTKKDFKLSIFGYTIGDSGGAAILSRVSPKEQRGIRARWFSSQGSYWRLALAGSLEDANPNNKYFRSEGLELEETSIKYMPIGFQEITKMLGWDMSDIDLVVPHQIPVSILENMYHRSLGIPYDKLYWTFPQYGNLATASMPVAMCEALKAKRIKEGDKVLLAGAAAGFSAGFIGVII